MLQMQFIGERMEAQCLSKFTDEFQIRKTIWNFVNSLDVMLTVEWAWQMELVPIFQYKPMRQSLIGEYECLCKRSTSPLVHKLGVVQQWSTLIGMLN